jgi:hypothetical protein
MHLMASTMILKTWKEKRFSRDFFMEFYELNFIKINLREMFERRLRLGKFSLFEKI